jgi:hypothetical protein
MRSYTDSLRGYASKILARDGYRCRYCGLDGTASFSNWLALSEDHLLPKGHPNRNKEEFRVASCQFCNAADNRYLEKAMVRGDSFEGLTPEALVALRMVVVQKTRDEYRRYWEQNIAPRSKEGAQSPVDL